MFPTILTTQREDQLVLMVCGELDLSTREMLEERCAGIDTSGADVVLDLTGLTFVDCGSLRLLEHFLRSCSDRGARTEVICPDGPVRRVLDLTGFSDLHEVRVGPARQRVWPPEEPRERRSPRRTTGRAAG